MTARHRVFVRMWGVAVIAHLAGNWRYGDLFPHPTAIGLLLATAGALGTAAVVWPRRSVLLALGAVVPATALLEAPILSNHWLLAAFVSAAYLLSWGAWERFETAARVILLVFYSFAAFAKLNTGFLDPVTSCGRFYANQLLGAIGIPPLSAEGAPAWIVVVGSALIELSVPILLVVRRTRPAAVLLAVAFHGFISLDLEQHFYDFTAVLLALFALFLSDEYARRLEGIGEQVRPGLRRMFTGVILGLGLVTTAANVTPMTNLVHRLTTYGPFLWWVPYLVAVAWAAAGARAPAALRWRPDRLAIAFGALVFVNGLTPYLELKTAYGWNMYSNLVTLDGRSNHLLVRSTLPLRDGHRDLVTVVSSSDPKLKWYADERYRLPWPSFREYLARNPEAAVVFERGGSRVEIGRVGDTALAAPVPWWWRWMPLRSVSATAPARCQAVIAEAM